MDKYFSKQYAEARTRFLHAASKAGAKILSYPVSCKAVPDAAIDVAIVGKDNGRTIVISSGVHGVEGFFGSAIQLALLDEFIKGYRQPEIRYVLIHGVNPCGFANARRVNENNVDLNRNFVPELEGYRGAPAGYAELNAFLNPQTPPSSLEPFRLKALWNIWRYGLQSLKQSVAAGQYEFPEGLFYGGREPSQSMCIVRDHCDTWLSTAEHILHIDLHTGLGKSGTYKLYLLDSSSSKQVSWYREAFGKQNLEVKAEINGSAYLVTGSFGGWMREYFGSQKYRFITAEFGTHNIVRVLGAMRADNQAHFYGAKDSPVSLGVKKEMMECFCPEDSSWRRNVMQSGIKIVDQGAKALENC